MVDMTWHQYNQFKQTDAWTLVYPDDKQMLEKQQSAGAEAFN